MTIRHPGQSRSGFTLVELLMVIAVIGILVGMISAALIPALRRAKETAVITEIKQLEMSLEQFKNQYGFYPPSFETAAFTPDVFGANALLPYINRIAPNHSERNSTGLGAGSALDGSRTRLEHWWLEVGQYLDQESSIVFWLSGVCKNKQYPITGVADISTWAIGTPPLAAHALNYTTDLIERDVFYPFKLGQIYGNSAPDDVDQEIVQDKGVDLPIAQRGFILEYRQPHGAVEGDSITSPDGVTALTDYRYKYREAASYDLGGGNRTYYNGASDGSADAIPIWTVPLTSFANPGSFQIITFGMDGLPGVPGNCHAINGGRQTIGGTDFFGAWGADNLCNFTEGRLEKWVIENSK